MARLLLSRQTTVSPSYHQFMVFDPACDEPDQMRPAITAAITGGVGWAGGVVAIGTELDLAAVVLDIDVYDGDPGGSPGGTERLAVPTGQLAVDKSPDDEFQRGIDLPAGPGTYRARLIITGRDEARRRYDEAFAPGWTSASSDAKLQRIAGTEQYRLQLWHVDPEPDWTTGEDD